MAARTLLIAQANLAAFLWLWGRLWRGHTGPSRVALLAVRRQYTNGPGLGSGTNAPYQRPGHEAGAQVDALGLLRSLDKFLGGERVETDAKLHERGR